MSTRPHAYSSLRADGVTVDLRVFYTPWPTSDSPPDRSRDQAIDKALEHLDKAVLAVKLTLEDQRGN